MINFSFAVFLSAFLLFLVQPLVSKYILPWFGGTPAVWSISLLFFQALLTAGYAYAYWLIAKFDSRRQVQVHSIFVGVSLVALLVTGLQWSAPITPDISWRPSSSDSPIGDIFKILLVSVGLPYFILATNGPLMQAWFSRTYPAHSSYRLYALSNLGSLLALVSYPVLIEPTLTLTAQGQTWAIGYMVFAALAILNAFRSGRTSHVDPEPTAFSIEVDSTPSTAARVLWLVLPACASALLLATTNQITQEIAVIPFLWVLPLTLYLLTFVLTFDSDRWYARTLFTFAFFILSAIVAAVLAVGPTVSPFVQIAAYAGLLFVCCMICHGELVRLKPHARYLTSFYLMISLGGAVGGIAVSLIAPLGFKGYWELPLGLILCALLLIWVTWRNRQVLGFQRMRLNLTLIAGALVLTTGVFIFYLKSATVDAVESSRNFYGTLRVDQMNLDQPDQRAFRLAHGATSHGFQFVQPERRNLPTMYYTEKSGIGLTLLNASTRPAPLRIGVLGLGIGILAAYTQPGDVIRFYEINPEVIRLASGAGGYFSFLKDARGQVQIVPGDARISLEKELADGQAQHFDVLVLDTFTGDSIPVHLVTREAFAVYLQHLQSDGVLALHISNNYLDLRPVVYRLADEMGLSAALVETQPDGDRTALSTWMLLTRNQKFLVEPTIATRVQPRNVDTNRFRLWTDDYSNLFQIVR
ncbi:MAG: spermidine synthase [Chloroflexi bacterium]|nr:spermidine synthase [Chloroflexota bacterium]